MAGIWNILSGEKTIARFNQDVCKFFGVRYALSVSSGRAGLSLLFSTLKKIHPDRNEVLLPAYTSYSVPSAVVNSGLKVSLYDMEPATLSPDSGSLAAAINDKTLCIVVCHLFGYPSDFDTVLELARKRQIPVIDDAAQAMGATYKGRYAGTLGHSGIFSLSRGKNISTVDGGIIVTDSVELMEALSLVKLTRVGVGGYLNLLVKAVAISILLRPCLYWIPARLLFLQLGVSRFDPDFPLQKFTAFQAEIGRRILDRLAQITECRVNRAKATMAGCGKAGKESFIKPVVGAKPVFLRLPVLAGNKLPEPAPELGMIRSYPSPVSEIPELQAHLVKYGEFPGAKYLSGHLLTLPTHEFVTTADMEKIYALCGGRDYC